MSQIADICDEADRARRDGRPDVVAALLQKAETLARQADDPTDLAMVFARQGRAERDAGRLLDALNLYEAAVAQYRRSDNTEGTASGVRHCGDILQELGELKAADHCYIEALALYRELDPPPPLGLANTLRPMALLAELLAQPARPLWLEARDLYARTGIQAGVEECDRHLGH